MGVFRNLTDDNYEHLPTNIQRENAIDSDIEGKLDLPQIKPGQSSSSIAASTISMTIVLE